MIYLKMYKKLLIMSLLAFQAVSANEIEFLEVKEKKDRSVEISFLLEKVSYVRSYSLTEPSRIVIEIEDSKLASTEPMDFNFPIKKIRSSQEGSISKITIDLYEYVNWTKPTQMKSENGVVLGLAIKRTKNISKNIRDIIVSIDAGHGGRDPGAVGTNNVLEKDINLLIAKELERTLRDVKGYKPVMIRNDDSFVDLNERYLRARREAADISISIHADGFRLSSVKGASVFIWSKEYSSITAENLSKKQLKSKIGEIDEEDFDEDKAQVKYPAKYKSKLDESKKLGNSILAQLKEDPYTKLHKKNVEYADFRVLKSFDTPSVLVEAGFISNPDDAERLKGKPGRRMIARSIFLGIHDYFKKNKHSESRFDSNSEYVLYEIQRGDVLSEIAVRFGVSVGAIQKENALKNSPIYPGQIIKIKI